MARILRTPQADVDLADIWSYVAADNLEAADELVRKFDEMMQRLAENPDIGIPQFQYSENLRCKPVARQYLIFYEPTSEGIRVVRFLHGARDWPGLLQ